MTKTVINIKNFKRLSVPRKVAVCPYCDIDADLFVDEIDEWSIDDNGKITVEHFGLSCVNEPDIDGEDYVDTHCNMPYVFWLPVFRVVKRWLNAAFEFVNGDTEKEKLDRWVVNSRRVTK